MSNELPDNWPTILTALIAGVGGLMAWLLNLQRQMSGKLSREEHEKICAAQNAEMHDELKQIKAMIEKRDDQGAVFKQVIQDTLQTINIRLAVLTRDAVIDKDKT